MKTVATGSVRALIVKARVKLRRFEAARLRRAPHILRTIRHRRPSVASYTGRPG